LAINRGNPFATAEADQERELLPEFYADVEGYELIKSDKTVTVFAPRGGGKSALRVILASQAAPISPKATTLTVEYTNFDALIAQRRNRQSLSVDDHIQRVLRTSTEALLNTFCGYPITISSEAKDRQLRAVRAASLIAPDRSRLAHLLRKHHPTLLDYHALYERYRDLDPVFEPSWIDFISAVRERRLRQLLAYTRLKVNEIACLLADLNDYPDLPTDEVATSVEEFKALVSLTRTLGLTSIQFLVDRLDENLETASDQQAQADILEPLLAHLPLLEMPGVAFKFSLSRGARNILLERPTIRRDRLTDQSVTVVWEKNRLKQVLNERLAVYSDGKISDLTQLCQETWVEVGRGKSPHLL